MCTSGLVREGTYRIRGYDSIQYDRTGSILEMSLADTELVLHSERTQMILFFFLDSLHSPEENCKVLLGMNLEGEDLWSVWAPKVQDCCGKCKNEDRKHSTLSFL